MPRRLKFCNISISHKEPFSKQHERPNRTPNEESQSLSQSVVGPKRRCCCGRASWAILCGNFRSQCDADGWSCTVFFLFTSAVLYSSRVHVGLIAHAVRLIYALLCSNVNRYSWVCVCLWIGPTVCLCSGVFCESSCNNTYHPNIG